MAELVGLREAVAGLVTDGDTVALEGFTHLIPFAAAHEIIRQEKRDLTLVRMTPDLVYDQMIGMGTARKQVLSWGGNRRGREPPLRCVARLRRHRPAGGNADHKARRVPVYRGTVDGGARFDS